MILVSSKSYTSSPDVYIFSASASHPAFTIVSRVAVAVGGTFSPGNSGEVDADWMIQGKMAYGKLRDKEVQHGKVTGSISLNLNAPYSVNPDGSLHIVSSSGSSIDADALGTTDGASYTATVVPKTIVGTQGNWYKWSGVPSLELTLSEEVLTQAFYQPPSVLYDHLGNVIQTNPGGIQYTYYRVQQRNGGLYMSSASSSPDAALAKSATMSPYCLRKAKLVPQLTDDFQSLLDLIKSEMHFSLLENVVANFDYGELSVEIAKSQNYVDQNILLIVQDCISLGSLLRTEGSVVKGVNEKLDITKLPNFGQYRQAMSLMRKYHTRKVPKHILKKIAYYLSNSILLWRYAISPDIGDTKRFVAGIQKRFDSSNSSQRLHSRRTGIVENSTPVISVSMGLTCEVQSYSQRDWPLAMEIISSAKRWGMYPELQNLYDIIPFSFVVDWFIQYGDFFESIDNYLNLENYFPVGYSISSAKAACSYPASTFFEGATGSVKVTQYERWIMDGGVPLPKVSLSANTTLANHWVEVGALVAQRL